MVDYRRFLPDPPEECRDPELFRMLNEFHYVRWHPDHADRRDELMKLIFSEPILHRAAAATRDPYERLRLYAGELLIWVRRNDGADITLRLLRDPSEHVRGGIARMLSQLNDDSYVEPLANLARNDPSPFVRGSAALGLGGQDPVRAIPVLIEILDNDHQPDATGHTPSGSAATALDEMMETEWTQKRYEAGLRGLPPEGVNLDALREQALVFLEHRRKQKGQ